jgi:predicted AAA+ superfamily ATPase
MGFENISEILSHPAFGALWETHIVMQVIKYYVSQGKRPPLWYWQTVHGAEVDLLIEKAGRFCAVEIKTAENPDAKSLKGMNALKKIYGDESIIHSYIACRTRTSYPLSENAQAVAGSQIDLYLP